METKILNYFIDYKEILFPKVDLKSSTNDDIIKINKLLSDSAISNKKNISNYKEYPVDFIIRRSKICDTFWTV